MGQARQSYPTSAMSGAGRNRDCTEIEYPACHALTDFSDGVDGLAAAVEEQAPIEHEQKMCNECESSVANLYCAQCEVEFCYM